MNFDCVWEMNWTVKACFVVAFASHIGVLTRMSFVAVCSKPFFVDSYPCRPFPQIVSDILGCAFMGLTTNMRLMSDDYHIVDGERKNRDAQFAHFVFRSGFTSVVTSLSAWIVASAHYYHRGDWPTAIFTVIIPGFAFFMSFKVAQDIALFLRLKLHADRIFRYINFTVLNNLAAGCACIVVVCAGGLLSVTEPADADWLIILLFAPIGCIVRIFIQEHFNRRKLPLGTILCNIIACTSEAFVIVTIGGTSTLGSSLLEGLIASTSTVASVVHETFYLPGLRQTITQSGIAFLVYQIVLCTVIPLCIFSANDSIGVN